jgi:hypothetical protein
MSSGVMSSIKSGRFFGKALTLSLRLFKRKSPPAITPLESPMILLELQ